MSTKRVLTVEAKSAKSSCFLFSDRRNIHTLGAQSDTPQIGCMPSMDSLELILSNLLMTQPSHHRHCVLNFRPTLVCYLPNIWLQSTRRNGLLR